MQYSLATCRRISMMRMMTTKPCNPIPSRESTMVENPILHLLHSRDNQQQNLTNHDSTINLKTLHAYSITTGLIKDNLTASRVVQFCFRSSDPGYAQIIFASLHQPDVYTWNAMIIGNPQLAISYYFQMRYRSLPPNVYTFALLIKTCVIMISSSGSSLVGSAMLCREIHGQVVKHGVEDLLVVKNSLINMYCKLGCLNEAHLVFGSSLNLDVISWNSMISAFGKNGDVKSARELFDEMPERNLVSWSAMIDGYVRNGGFSEALVLFNEMQALDNSSICVKPDIVILVSVLKACANLGALDVGKWVHFYIDKNKLQKNLVLGTALVDMYAKCGCIDVALELFNEISHKDVILWNSMIGGLALHGHGNEALRLFHSMSCLGILPNETTFVTILCACAHAGMVSEGIEIFQSLKAKYNTEPKVEHYGCLADLLGRAGLVREAEEVLVNMPMEPQASQLGALMAACRTHNNVEVGERVGKRLISMEPHDGGRYVLLSNIYASAGRWEDARDTRKEMEEKGAKKETGCSFIEMDGIVNEFVVGDTRHPQSREIYAVLGDLEMEMKKVGFVQGSYQNIDSI